MTLVPTDPPRVPLDVVDAFAPYGVADDDGIAVVPRVAAADTLADCEARERREAGNRVRFAKNELGLDIHGMREGLARKGLVYRDHAGHHRSGG